MSHNPNSNQPFSGRSVLESLLEAFYAGDMEVVSALLSPDVTVHQSDNLPYSGEWKGVSGFFDMATTLGSNFEIENLSRRIIEQGNEAVLFLDLKFTSRKTGKVGYTTNLEWYTFEDGKIADINVYYKDAVVISALNDE
ncbi:nuclear transport factor 2 family protein [Agreia sp.]|uniref:nuclear transport factor 2 family protein n=1 Tax=Agreia sp. TaxID=1872416 RepID=UPI0035BBAD27